MRNWIGSVLIFGFSHSAIAGLGDADSDVAREQRALSTSHYQMTAAGGYSVHEFSAPHQMIRQYASAGRVFAVSWSGIQHPVFSTLLGSNYEKFQTMHSGPRHSRGPAQYQAGNLVVQFGGHGHDLRGLAYLTDALPAGFKPEDIR